MVRQIGALEGNRPVSDNDWETVTQGGEAAIKRWIAGQMHGRSCTVVLVGEKTAGRKWINHEIIESWNDGMGIVGLHIHGLKNLKGYIAEKGANPFTKIDVKGKSMASIVKCYNPQGSNSKERYAWIAKYLAGIADEAVQIRNKN